MPCTSYAFTLKLSQRKQKFVINLSGLSTHFVSKDEEIVKIDNRGRPTHMTVTCNELLITNINFKCLLKNDAKKSQIKRNITKQLYTVKLKIEPTEHNVMSEFKNKAFLDE